MYVLGINVGHDSGAALITKNKIIAAINEERLSRIKMHHGFPAKSIKEVLSIGNISYADLSVVAIEGKRITPTVAIGFDKHNSDWRKIWLGRLGLNYMMLGTSYGIYIVKALLAPASFLSHMKIKKRFRDSGFKGKFIFVDHHYAHAASAYYSQKENGLAVTLDANGEGYCSKVYKCNNGAMSLVHSIPCYHSPAYYYAYITKLLGFKPLRHEGKITGLAAFGRHEEVVKILEQFINFNVNTLSFENSGGFHLDAISRLQNKLSSFVREDVAAGIQFWTEKLVSEYISSVVKKFGNDAGENILVAGGMFANVKINQRILEQSNVKNMYIFPNMGDGGLGLGAAQSVIAKNMIINNMYLGRDYNDSDIEDELLRKGVRFYKAKNIASEVAIALNEGKVVARYTGRMEYGPRALGDRSIIYKATNSDVNDWLNKRLNRTEFMPFAPFVRNVDYLDYFKISDDIKPFRFMTITCNVTDKCINEAPAITHVDKTARPQIIYREDNPTYYDILTEYKSISGIGVLVNTSFNMHEEPIVNNPAEAIDTFSNSGIDILAIGNFIAKR